MPVPQQHPDPAMPHLDNNPLRHADAETGAAVQLFRVVRSRQQDLLLFQQSQREWACQWTLSEDVGQLG